MGYIVHPDGRIEAATPEEAVELARLFARGPTPGARVVSDAPAPRVKPRPVADPIIRETLAQLPRMGQAPTVAPLRLKDIAPKAANGVTLLGKDLREYRQRHGLNQTNVAHLMKYGGAGTVSVAETNQFAPLPERMAT